jgi:hypothetical protein
VPVLRVDRAAHRPKDLLDMRNGGPVMSLRRRRLDESQRAMAGVRIDTGPVDHDTPWAEVRPDRKFLILGAWQQFFHVDIKYDCRELLRIVEDMRANEAWTALGFADLEDLLRRGVEIDSELVGWAMRGLRVFDPNEPLPFETAVFVGRELMAHDEAGKRGGRGKKAIRNREGLSSDTVEYIKARLRRDDPALAARVERGELTANAAAVAKGWRKTPTRVERMLRDWREATEDERVAVLQGIAALRLQESAADPPDEPLAWRPNHRSGR